MITTTLEFTWPLIIQPQSRERDSTELMIWLLPEYIPCKLSFRRFPWFIWLCLLFFFNHLRQHTLRLRSLISYIAISDGPIILVDDTRFNRNQGKHSIKVFMRSQGDRGKLNSQHLSHFLFREQIILSWDRRMELSLIIDLSKVASTSSTDPLESTWSFLFK